MSVDCATGVIKQIEELFVTSMESFRSASSAVPYIYIYVVLVVILVVVSRYDKLVGKLCPS